MVTQFYTRSRRKGAEEGSDEGSALIELAYDIAPAATYKFFSANFGELVSWLRMFWGES